MRSWSREPTLHFFLIGALLFVVHGAFVGDARTIEVTAGVKADLARRFIDLNGRRPSRAELDRALVDWKRDEALYREALRDGLESQDATIRTVLADKVRARAALAAPKREPSQGDLDRWLEGHRALYEIPLRYEFEFVAFARNASAARELESYEQALTSGAQPNQLGRPIAGAALSSGELRVRFGSMFADAVARFPLGTWQRFEGEDQRLLVRVKRTLGGLPVAEELRARLIADWSRAMEQREVDRAVQQIVDRYRFEERP